MQNILELSKVLFVMKSAKIYKKLIASIIVSLFFYLLIFKIVNCFQCGLTQGMPDEMRNTIHLTFITLIFLITFAIFEQLKRIYHLIYELFMKLTRQFYKPGKYTLKMADFIREGIVRDIIKNKKNSILELTSSSAGIISKKGCFSDYQIEFSAELKPISYDYENNKSKVSGFGFISHALDHHNYFMLKIDINEKKSVLSAGPLIKKDSILYIYTRDLRSEHSVDNQGERFQFIFYVTRETVQVCAYQISDTKKEKDIFKNKAIYNLPEKYAVYEAKPDDANRDQNLPEISDTDKTFFPKLNKFGFRADGPEILRAENLILKVFNK